MLFALIGRLGEWKDCRTCDAARRPGGCNCRLELAKAFVPEVTLCDIGMPGLDGYQVARQWRRDPVLQAMSLIAITGYGRAQGQALAREAGFDRHLTKPASAETLLDLVAALVQAGRQRRAAAETTRA